MNYIKKATPPKKTTTGISLNVECITHLKSTFSELAHMLRIPSHHGRLFLNLRIKKKWNKKNKNIYTHNINIIFKKNNNKAENKKTLGNPGVVSVRVINPTANPAPCLYTAREQAETLVQPAADELTGTPRDFPVPLGAKRGGGGQRGRVVVVEEGDVTRGVTQVKVLSWWVRKLWAVDSQDC